MKETFKIAIAGGGTGGHIFPGLSILEELSKLKKIETLWIGTGRPIEKKILVKKDLIYRVIEVKPIKGGSFLKALSALLGLPVPIIKSIKLLRQFKPHVVLGVGGYVSGPVLVASKFLKIPSAIHEQNTLPGLTNRISARFADKIFISFKTSYKFFDLEKTEYLGNPVRWEILEQGLQERKDDNFNILIIGGSQGAKSLNRLVSSSLEILKKSGRQFQAIHQCGSQDKEYLESFYKKSNCPVDVREFIDKIGIAYSWADLIICRAGASTIAEITALGKPAIYIPYPYSADGHQELNAKAICEEGAGIYFIESEVGAITLASEIERLMTDEKRLNKMALKAKSLGRPEAARAISESLLKLAAT